MAKKSPPPTRRAANPPEKKIGPYSGGISIAIWLNRVETDDGPRDIRSLTISPRRYKDRATGEWRDAPSLRPSDLPALIFALQKAQEYVYTTPVPNEAGDEPGDGEIPY